MTAGVIDRTHEPGEGEQAQAPGHVRGYTIALGTLALGMLLGAVTMYSVLDAPTTNPDSRWALVLVMRIEIFVALAAGLVVAFRVRRSSFAYIATAAFSWLLLFSVPIGTALFIYWVLKVRPRERPA